MVRKYYKVQIAELDAHAGDTAGGYDAKGLHTDCIHHDTGGFGICSPNPDMPNNDPVVEVIIGIKNGSDPTTHYASATEKTSVETKAYLVDPANDCVVVT